MLSQAVCSVPWLHTWCSQPGTFTTPPGFWKSHCNKLLLVFGARVVRCHQTYRRLQEVSAYFSSVFTNTECPPCAGSPACRHTEGELTAPHQCISALPHWVDSRHRDKKTGDARPCTGRNGKDGTVLRTGIAEGGTGRQAGGARTGLPPFQVLSAHPLYTRRRPGWTHSSEQTGSHGRRETCRTELLQKVLTRQAASLLFTSGSWRQM